MEESKDLSCYTYEIKILVSTVAKDEKEAEERVESGLGYLVNKTLTIVGEEKLTSLPK